MPLSLRDLAIFIIFIAGCTVGYVFFQRRFKRGGVYFLLLVAMALLLGNLIEAVVS